MPTLTLLSLSAWHTASSLKGEPARTLPRHRALAKALLRSPSTVTQVVLATAHPAKFSEAVTSSLESAGAGFNFERDVLPKEFEGLLERERRVFSSKASPEAVKAVIEEHVGHLVQAKA